MMTPLHNSPLRIFGVAAVALLFIAATAVGVRAAGSYAIDWWTVDGGGQTSTGAGYALTGTVGQPDAQPAPATGGGYQLQGGFWHNPADAGAATASIAVTKTVGTDDGVCATTTTLKVEPDTTVYFCVTIRNTGAVTFTHTDISDAQLGVGVSIDQALPPGTILQVTNQQAPALAWQATTPLTNTVVVTAANFIAAAPVGSAAANVVGRIEVAALSTAIVTIGTPTVDPNEPEPGTERIFLPMITKPD
jgi:hypothetical protein